MNFIENLKKVNFVCSIHSNNDKLDKYNGDSQASILRQKKDFVTTVLGPQLRVATPETIVGIHDMASAVWRLKLLKIMGILHGLTVTILKNHLRMRKLSASKCGVCSQLIANGIIY